MVEERRLYGILQYVAHGSLTQPSSPFTIQVLLVLQPLRIKLSLKDQRHVYLMSVLHKCLGAGIQSAACASLAYLSA